MKKSVLILVTAFTFLLNANSQVMDDAVRYSQIFYGGTSRFIAMGGAFTSLGADLSSIGLNPAGTGMFRSFEITFTPQMFYNNASSVFYGTNSSDFKYAYGLNQIGIVTNLKTTNNTTGLISINGAYSYQRTNNFNENIIVSGYSTNSSMADYWAASANGKFKEELNGTVLNAAKAWLIDTITGFPKLYATVFSHYGDSTFADYGQKVRRIINNEGYSGEHSFSIGANFSEKYFFGATLGISRLKYTGHYEHLEADVDELVYDFKDFTFTDHFEAIGTGYSLKLGAILRPVEMLRIGLAFHSPVIYRIHEYYSKNTSASFENPDSEGNYSYSYEFGPYRNNYTLTTPLRAMLGVSVQLKKLGVLSADYEFVDYRMARLSNGVENYNYFDENKSIKESLKAASNLRLGAEFRITKLYLRAGYGYYGSAFKKGESNQDLNYNTISFGLGFRQENFFFDMGLTNLSYTQNTYLYYDPGYLEAASIKNSKSTFTTTLGFKF